MRLASAVCMCKEASAQCQAAMYSLSVARRMTVAGRMSQSLPEGGWDGKEGNNGGLGRMKAMGGGGGEGEGSLSPQVTKLPACLIQGHEYAG